MPVYVNGVEQGGAITRAGGNTTEATTTSTSAADVLSVASMSIAVGVWIALLAQMRKTTGAAVAVGGGLTLNATVTVEATLNPRLVVSSTTNQAESRSFMVVVPPRVTTYVGQGTSIGLASGILDTDITLGTRPTLTAAPPEATLTDVVVRGIVGDAAVTLGADELQVYSLAAS